MESKGASDVHLQSYLDHVLLSAEHVDQYLNVTKDYLHASHEAEYNYMVKLAASLGEMAKIAQRILAKCTLQDICDLYEVHAVLSAAPEISGVSMSSSQARDLQAVIKKDVIKLRNDLSIDITPILTQEDAPTYYKIIEQSSSITAPILQLVEFCIDKVTFAQRVRLEQLLEAKKDAVLGVTAKFLQCDYPATMSFLCKNGLCSQTDPLDPAALFTFLGRKYSAKKSWQENLATLDCNVIVVDNQVGTPMTFQLRTLIDEDYIKTSKLIVAPAAGVTATTIKKMKTITMTARVGDTHGAPPTKYEKNPALSWLVLDTLDGATYRVLGTPQSIMFDQSEIRSLLQGCPMRVAKYQELMGDIITQAAYKPDLNIMCDLFAKRPTLKFSADLVRKKSLEKQLEFFAANYRKMTSDFTWDPWAIIEVAREIITLPEIYEIIMENISELYQISPNVNTEDELYRLTQYDIMSRLFYQEFDKRFDADRDKIISELTSTLEFSGMDKVTPTLAVLQRKLRDILGLSADKLDNLHLWTDYGISLKNFVAR